MVGITSAKEKDGLAAMTRERKQKQFTKPELRQRWNERISAEEMASIQDKVPLEPCAWMTTGC
jgi:hypothetical protein